MGRLRYHCLSGLLLLFALAAKAEEATTATVPCDSKDDKNKEHKFTHFTEIFYTVIFIILVWISGKIAAAAGAPSLVGEILVGVILGPHVVDFVPFPSALKSIGEVGLCLHALEAGLMVDVEMLEIVGARGLAVGFVGPPCILCPSAAISFLWSVCLPDCLH